MLVSLIWAMADDRVIGLDNRLPWKLPADMHWFRRHTLGKPIVMGRLTFESFGAKPLPGRRNLIVSRDGRYAAAGAEVFTSLAAALAAAQAAGAQEVMVIGGMSLYTQALPLADRLYLTRVHAKLAGDAWFPEFDLQQWREVAREEHAPDEKNAYACEFLILERGRAPTPPAAARSGA
jgi:dihydrofolate reductase